VRRWCWLKASSYVSGRAGRGTPVYDHPNLRVLTTTPEHLLAAQGPRRRAARDADDVRLLLAKLGIRSVAEVEAITSRYFPSEPLGERSRQLVEDLLHPGTVDPVVAGFAAGCCERVAVKASRGRAGAPPPGSR